MIATIFGKEVKAVEHNHIDTCNKCVFNNRECYSHDTARQAKCMGFMRDSGIAVYYVEVE